MKTIKFKTVILKSVKKVTTFLLAMLMVSSVYAGANADYTKTVTGQGGALFSLSKGDAAALISTFDAMPKNLPLQIHRQTIKKHLQTWFG